MANVLGELFSNIANAIREKTGDSATMKPAEFPEKISGIEVGGGSGGGTLPAGLYWETLDIPLPNKYTQKWVVFNGDLYSFANSQFGNGYFQYIYKWENGSWSAPISNGGFGNWAYPNNLAYIEYNGKLHGIGGDKNSHVTFDGASVTTLNTLPSTVNSAFVENGVLKACRSLRGDFYAWDEASDTWTSEGRIAAAAGLSFINCGDTILATAKNKLYSYAGGTLTNLSAGIDLTFTSGVFFVQSGYLYSYVANDFHGPDLYRYDPILHTVELVGRIPTKIDSLNAFDYRGDLCFLNTTYSDYYASTSPWIMREIKSSE